MEEWLNSFGNWMPLTSLCVGELPRYGDVQCVYVMRSTSTGEILYIGSTSNLRRRVFGNYLGGVGGATTKRLHGILFLEMKVGEIELAYEETIAYRQREAELKEAYRQQQGRLPKWNKL